MPIIKKEKKFDLKKFVAKEKRETKKLIKFCKKHNRYFGGPRCIECFNKERR